MTATAPPPYTPPTVNSKQQFIDVWTRENATTRRVLAAFADGLGEFTPNERCKTAREVAYIFVRSQTRRTTNGSGRRGHFRPRRNRTQTSLPHSTRPPKP